MFASLLLFLMSIVIFIRIYNRKRENWWHGRRFWSPYWRRPWNNPYVVQDVVPVTMSVPISVPMSVPMPVTVTDKAIQDCLEINKDNPEKCKKLIDSLKQ